MAQIDSPHSPNLRVCSIKKKKKMFVQPPDQSDVPTGERGYARERLRIAGRGSGISLTSRFDDTSLSGAIMTPAGWSSRAGFHRVPGFLSRAH